jgi:transposase
MNEIPVNTVNNQKRKRKTISDELRELIINSMSGGKGCMEASKQFGLKHQTVSDIYRKYVNEGVKTTQPRGHRQRIPSDQQKEVLCDWVDEDVTLTLNQLKQKCLNEWPNIETISLTTINNALKDFHFSFKRVTIVPERRNDPYVITDRYNYAVKYNQMMVEKEKMFFLDEMGVQIWSRRGYGRSLVGTRAYKRKRVIRGRNYSIACAMSVNSLYLYKIQDIPYNSDHFVNFLNQLFFHLSEDNITGGYLIMDNVRFHHTEEVTHLVTAHGHNAVFIPPYCPFLNPIEEMFSQWKWFVKRSQPISEDQLYEAVHNTSEEISADNCLNYVKHMEAYLSLCLRKEVIEN